MNKKIFNARFCPKGDIEANWNKAIGFVPLDREIIIYKPDETHSITRIKVGDGKTSVNDLSFVSDIETIKRLIDDQGKLLVEYVDNAVLNIRETTIPEALNLIEEKFKDCPRVETTWIDIVNGDGPCAPVDEHNVSLKDIYVAEFYDIIVEENIPIIGGPPSEIRMEFNGTSYSSLPIISLEGYGDLFGNLSFVDFLAPGSFEEPFPDTGEPFLGTFDDGTIFFRNESPIDTCHIFIEAPIEQVFQLDPKYIPIDVNYQPDSELPQSGKAVKEALDQTKREIKDEIEDVYVDLSSVSTFTLDIETPTYINLRSYPTVSNWGTHGFSDLYKDFGEGITTSNTYTAPGGSLTIKIYGLTQPNLGSMYWGDNIQGRSFYGNLIKLEYGNTVYELKNGEFGYVPRLEHIVLGSGIRTVAPYAFRPNGETQLQTITIKNPILFPYNAGMFNELPFLQKIYVPREDLDRCLIKYSDVADKLEGVDLNDYSVDINQEELDRKRVTILEFDIQPDSNPSKYIDLSNIEGATRIDWGDGSSELLVRHGYPDYGRYQCKIYDLKKCDFYPNDGILDNEWVGINLVSISMAESVENIETVCFMYSQRLEQVKFSQKLKTIGYRAFYGCSNLLTLTIPDSVTSIGDNAFAYSGIKTIVFGNGMSSITPWACSNCANLETVILPEKAIAIQSEAFQECPNLKNIDLSLVTFIGNNAFMNSFTYEEEVELTLPSLTSLDVYAFKGSNIHKIDLSNSVIDTIASGAFQECSNLTEVKLPETIRWINDGAFCCSRNLSIINFPNKIDTISEFAFESTGITKAIVPKNTAILGNACFAGCLNLTEVEILAQDFNCGSDLFASAPVTKLTIYGYMLEVFSNFAAVTLKNTLKEVVFLDEYINILHGLQFYSKLEKVTLPKRVEAIGSAAFRYCENLLSVSIPASVSMIYEQAFEGCYDLHRIIFNNPSPILFNNSNFNFEILMSAFNECHRLKEIVVPFGSKEAYTNALMSLDHFDPAIFDQIKIIENTKDEYAYDFDSFLNTFSSSQILSPKYREKWLDWLGIGYEIVNITTVDQNIEPRKVAILKNLLTLFNEDQQVYSQYYSPKEEMNLSSYPDNEKFTFVGWADAEGNPPPAVMPFYDLILYAQWKVKPYTLTIKQEGVEDRVYTFGASLDVENGIDYTPADLDRILNAILPVRTETELYYYKEEIPETFEFMDYIFTVKVATPISISEALILGAAQEENTYTEETYLVSGTIVNISDAEYGDAVIADADGNTIYVHGMYSTDVVRYDAMETKPVLGDFVKLQSAAGNYNGVPQLKNTKVIDFNTPETLADIYKSIIESFNLSLPTEIKEAGDVAVATIGITYPEVSINWSSSDTTIAMINNNVITFTLPKVNTDITIAATLICGESQYIKTFVITVRKELGEAIVVPVTFGVDGLKGQQYVDEEYVINENLTISSHNNGCHFATQLRIYDSSTTDGWVILACKGAISSLDINMGYKKCDLLVYGSIDGSTWESVGTITTTSTSFLDYSLNIDEHLDYKYLKLDASGAQLRIKSLSVTMFA